MTERVDHDRLADFVGGALDGTPDAAAVRALIETDPGWAEAHADLVAATAAVSADLRSVGRRAPAVPADVAARLDAMFRQLESDPRAAGAASTGADEPATARPGRADGAHTRPGGTTATASGPRGAGRSGPGGAGPGRRPSRRAKWAAGLSAVAAVIAVGVGFVSMVPIRGSDDATSGGAADSAAEAPAPQSAAGGPPPVASGRDYRPDSFGGLGSSQRTQAVPPEMDASGPHVAGGEPFSRDDPPATVPAELIRLTGPEARQGCLDAIMRVHGGMPTVVEYARFTGKPALVVLLAGASTGGGRPWVVVAGPDCGLVAGDADELYNGPLA
jgi:hypothetical protein